jgi:hypothetical protein
MPRTSSRSSTLAKRPLLSRWSMMAAAVAGPTPGSASSSSAVAVLRSIGPDVVGTPDEPPPLPVAPPPSGASVGGASSPIRGTNRRWPSATGAARLSRSRSASGAGPPAASNTSATRAPGASRWRPGRTTAPAACTTISPVVVELVAPAGDVVTAEESVTADAANGDGAAPPFAPLPFTRNQAPSPSSTATTAAAPYSPSRDASPAPSSPSGRRVCVHALIDPHGRSPPAPGSEPPRLRRSSSRARAARPSSSVGSSTARSPGTGGATSGGASAHGGRVETSASTLRLGGDDEVPKGLPGAVVPHPGGPHSPRARHGDSASAAAQVRTDATSAGDGRPRSEDRRARGSPAGRCTPGGRRRRP